MALLPLASWLALLALAAGPGRQAWALHASDTVAAAKAVFAGGGSLHPRLRVEHADQGASFVVTGRIVKGQVLVSLPADLLILPDESWAQRGFPPLESLALGLLREHDKGPASKHSAYIESLPTESGNALFLPAACGVESKRSFSSRAGQRVVSDFVAFVARCLAFADQVPGWTAERKMPRVEGAWASTGIDESTSKALPVSALRWAYAMALSRAFTLERGGGGHKFLHRVPFLAPGADLLDHGPSAPVGWVFDDESRQFRIVAAETLAPGVQVRNDYGALASSTLAARFGFVLASNPFEALPLRISSHRRPAAAATSACLASMGLRGSQQLTASGISEEFLDAARVASLFAQGQTRGSLSVLAALNGVSLPGLPRAPDNANRAVQTSDIAALCAEISASSQGRVARSLKLPAHQEIEMLNDLRVAIATMAGGVEAELADLQWRGSSPTGATMGAAEIGAHADSRRGRVRPRRRVFEGRQSSLPPLARSSRQSRDQPGGCGALTKAVAVELGLLRAAQSQVVARLAQAGRALDGSAPRLASGREVQPPIFRESRHSGPGAIGPDQLAEVGADGTITSLSSGGEAFEGSRIHVALDLDDAMAEGAEDSVGYAQAQ